MRLNLLPKRERPLPRTMIRPQFLVITAGILVLVLVSVGTYVQSLERASAEREYLVARQQRLALERQRVFVDELEDAIADLDDSYWELQQLEEQAAEGVSLSELQQIIGSAIGPIWLEQVEFDEWPVMVAGYGQDVAIIARYIRNLERADYTVILESVEPEDIAEVYTFRIWVEGGSDDDDPTDEE